MAELATLARPYAKAAVDVAFDTDQVELWQAQLSALKTVVVDNDLVNHLHNPNIDKAGKQSLIDALLTGADEKVCRLIHALVDNGKLALIESVEEQFHQAVAERNSQVNVSITSARALTQKQKASLEKSISSKLGCSIQLEETVDESLVAGAVLKINDWIVDNTVETQLTKLAGQLSE